MKLQLERDINNRFYINKNAYNYPILRIMNVYIDNRKLDESEYYMMGPRAVHINIPVEYPHRIFASIASIWKGNRIFK